MGGAGLPGAASQGYVGRGKCGIDEVEAMAKAREWLARAGVV